LASVNNKNMIQRIQTIFLLIASALGILSLKTSFYTGHRISDSIPKQVIDVTASYNILLTTVTVATATVAFLTIFLFKNRKLQMRIAITSLVLSLVTLLLYYWQSKSFDANESSLTLTAIVPIGIPVMIILAIRGIYKDEKLIKSVDRLR
jgi:hypothetical protein